MAADEGAAATPPAPPPLPGSPAVPELEEGRSRSEDRLKTKIPFLKFGEIEIELRLTKYFSSTFGGINVLSYVPFDGLKKISVWLFHNFLILLNCEVVSTRKPEFRVCTQRDLSAHTSKIDGFC